MEYLLLVSVTLLLGCGVVALVLERPAQLDERAAAGPENGPAARRVGRSGRPRCGQADTTPSAQRHASLRPGSTLLSPAVPDRHKVIPLDCRGESPVGAAPPYSPQELRDLLEQRPPASPRVW
jgi:hypothetical protein